MSVVWQTAANENITNEAAWTALSKLVLTRSNPKIERCYAILLFRLGNGEAIDISMFTDLKADLTDADVQEFLNLVSQL